MSTVGLNTATIQSIYANRTKQDQIEDSLSKKEYQDPLRVASNRTTKANKVKASVDLGAGSNKGAL